jgi:hypothetical protein
LFSPASLKGDSPTPIDERVRKRYLPIYLIIIFLSFIPEIIWEYHFLLFLWTENFYWIFFLLIPLNICISLYILQFGATLFSSLSLLICKLLYEPREGVFKRRMDDKNYRYWNLRNMVKKWPLFIVATNPLPWLKARFTLRFLGIKIGKDTICDNAWISSEFIEIGKNVIIGMGSSILSFGIEGEKFILKKIEIEDDVLIGAKCVVMPGTMIKKGAKLSAQSFTKYNQILEKGEVYLGHPARIHN